MGSLRRLGLAWCTVAAGLWVAGCAIETNVGPDSGGEVRVTLQRADPATLALAVTDGVEAGIAGAAMAIVPKGNLEVLTVDVIGVELLKRCDEAEGQEGQDGEDECEWVPVPVEDDLVILNLLDLPSEGEPPIVLAAGNVPQGDYHKLRALVDGGTANFVEPFSVGRKEYNAEDDYDVTIPSGRIKVDIELSVDEGNTDDVPLLFDDATFKKVVATGSGMIKVPPVLKSWTHM